MQPTIKSPPPPALGSSPSGSSPAARADAMRAQFARSTSSAAFASMTNVRGSPSGNWKAAMGQGVISLDAYEAPTVEELKRKIPSSPSAPRPQTASPPVKPLLPASPSLSVGRPLIPSSPTLSRPLGVPPLKVSTTPATPSPSRKEITNSNGTASERALKPEERYKKMLARAMAQEEQDTKTVVLRRRALSEPSFPSWEILNVIEAKDSEKYAPPSSARSDESSRSMSMSDPENSEQSLSEANDISPRESLTAGDSLLLSEDDTGGKSVVAGTVDRLVALLADENAPDKNYVDVMLKTHHYFIESHRLLRLLMDRFRDTAPLPLSTSLPTSLSPSPSLPSVHHSHPAHGQRSAPGSPAVSSASSPSSTPSLQSASSTVVAADAKHVYIQIRVVNVIKHWIENEPEDFDDATLRQSLIAHLERLRSQGDKCERWANHLHGLLLARRPPPLRQIPKPLLPKRMTEKHWNGEVSFLDIHPLELARQMTLVEWREFAVIRKREYYHKAWAKGEKEGSTGAAPNIGASIARFNRLSYWIATEVLLTPSPKQRITVLSRFIELAKHLEELNNFNGMMEVLSALNFSFIKRLKSVWKQVPSKLVKIVKKLDDLMDQAGNYRNYRAALQTRVPPVLPFQGVYLTDLTFIEEKPDRLVNGMVNYEKLVLVHKVLSDIQRHQSLPYNFESIECIQEFLKSPGLVLGDEQLWSHSKKCEPSVEAPLTQDSASTVIFNPAPYASTLDQIEEKERVLNKLQRESSDRALAGKMLRENNEKKEKKDKAAQASRAKEPAKKPRSAMASSLSAVTNILAVPSVSTSPPTVPALTSSPSLGVMPMRRAGSTSGEPAPHGPAPPQPKSPKHGVAATAPRPALVASSSDSMHMVQQRRLEREKERGSPVRAQHAGSPTPPVPQVRKEAETRERSASTSSDMSNSSSSMTTDRSGGSGKDKDKDGRDSKEKEKKEKHHRHHTREK